MNRSRFLCRRPFLECLEDRSLLNGHTLATATPLLFGPDQQASAAGSLSTTDFFKLTLSDTGRLTAQVHATGANSRLALLGPTGDLLIQSDGQSASNADDRIDQH